MEVNKIGKLMAADFKVISYVSFIDVEKKQLICFAHQFLRFILPILHSLEVE